MINNPSAIWISKGTRILTKKYCYEYLKVVYNMNSNIGFYAFMHKNDLTLFKKVFF